ncbi:bifunctional phosphopantothenoylcysteine decarboxylase/phosphopantothenate--cysteine ligase CoaBC [Frondihabitans australicus]|uniref:Coenzyme A biosynthesis bifunctional protein CoaBC n=1 Tax=Frondihabitans australicus TaxID=386892 RepID=A0A495IL40_9MICO|nr:bifunctional phosphopantothenoylcysteine decarboxylase/phosphopantothenate--cysteine ligase CoaBC [Frondihabitans australicus]RKR76653.1 phosphopantothenoylcysteine decarboxylase/phosphopantothenate--cysteine ligase [Frondihabitans australicus]
MDRLTVVVGITGGIAAYKAVGVVRLLVKAGHDVHVVPTEAALKFVGLPTLEALSRNPVTASLYDDVAAVRHVALGQSADLVIVAPATANTLAKLAAGLADDLLGTTILATKAPVLLAPAMHTEMWANAATQANVATLRSRGYAVVGPDSGALTGADSGPGRMSEPEAIVEAALALVGEGAGAQDLANLHVLVSAGGTREPLDPVRFLGNRSSGKQGVALANAALARGARVTLVAAHLEVPPPAPHPRLSVVDVSTAESLSDAMRSAATEADIVVMAAAVADYRPENVESGKIKKSGGGPLLLRLVENPDILAGLARDKRPGQVVVGFAAETAASRDELLDLGRAKAARKGADLLALNAVGWSQGFGTDENAVVLVTGAGDVVAEAAGTKADVADALLTAALGVRGAPA